MSDLTRVTILMLKEERNALKKQRDDLLAALKECLSELESLGWGEAGYTNRATAAIAKAKEGA